MCMCISYSNSCGSMESAVGTVAIAGRQGAIPENSVVPVEGGNQFPFILLRPKYDSKSLYWVVCHSGTHFESVTPSRVYIKA